MPEGMEMESAGAMINDVAKCRYLVLQEKVRLVIGWMWKSRTLRSYFPMLHTQGKAQLRSIDACSTPALVPGGSVHVY